MCSAALWHATVSLNFFLPTTLPTFLWKPTKVRLQALLAPFQPILSAGLPGPKALHAPHALNPPKSTIIRPILTCSHSLCPLPLSAADLSRCIVHTLHGRVRRHLVGFLHCFELCFRGELLSTLAAQKTVRKSDKMAPNSIR